MSLVANSLKSSTLIIIVHSCFFITPNIHASESTNYHKIPDIIKTKYAESDAIVVSARDPSAIDHFPAIPELPTYQNGGQDQFVLVSETNLTHKREKYLLSQDVIGIPLGKADELYFTNELQSSPPEQDQPIDRGEEGNHFEGDISGVELVSKPGSTSDMLNGQNVKNAVIDTYKLWKKGEIPYAISQSFSSYDRSVIRNSMNQISKVSCIKWRPRNAYDKDYVHILRDVGCYSRVGKVGGPQILSLGYGCMTLGTVVHEMLHAAGFWHEQSRPDRNDHVRIYWQNIQAGFDDNFARYSRAEVTTLSLPYDTGSVMHYATTAFSKNGMATIRSLKSKNLLGQRAGMSNLDIQKLNKLYGCGNKIPNPPSEIKCVDVYNNGWCYTWGRRGGCQRYKDFMKDYCPKTCNLCSELQVTVPLVIQSKCEDSDVRCPSWAKYTDFKCPSGFLKKNCPKSCRICTSPSFVETPNHDYNAVIIDGGHGIALGTANGNHTRYHTSLHILYITIYFVPLMMKHLLFTA